MNIRAAAAHVIFQVLTQGKSLSDCLPPAQTPFSDTRDQALLQALCFGVCRQFFYLEALLALLLEKPLKTKDQDVYALLLVGLYQLTAMRIPEYAAIAETVAAAKNVKKIWAKNLINAVLRNYQRRATELQTQLANNPIAHYAHPQWLIKQLQNAWPTEWEMILTANNAHPPLALRINKRRGSRDDYLKKLTAAGIAATNIPETSAGIVLAAPMDVKLLPGFMAGEVSVQDGAAQLAAGLLALAPGLRVLDACAAPGGKTAHIAEYEPLLAALIAIDHDAERLLAVTENLQRLQLSATCVASDVANVKQWWDGKCFDRILLDAPCSATGVIRRHPDIKLLRQATDLEQLSAMQLYLLTTLWPLLQVGGMLLYATCSVLPVENTHVVMRFLEAHTDAIEEKIQANWGQACAIGRQVLPDHHSMDGFYYALLRKC